MKSLKAYVTNKNKWNAMFKGEQFELKTPDGRMRVAESLEADMSPENLTCDGELPRAQVQARYKELTAAAEELVLLDNKLFKAFK